MIIILKSKKGTFELIHKKICVKIAYKISFGCLYIKKNVNEMLKLLLDYIKHIMVFLNVFFSANPYKRNANKIWN